MAELRVLFVVEPREVRRLNDSVARFLWERRVDPDRLHDVQLVIEELVSNVLRHGLANGGTRRVAVEIDIEADAVRLGVEDNCHGLDPTAAVIPDPTGTLEGRRPGGNGLRIARRLVTGLTYRRLAGGNRVEARIPLASPPPS